MDWEKIKEKDALKTKILKYIIYKKRTENEVRLKFNNIEPVLLDEIIQELKENNYINDFNYIERAIKEFICLKQLSVKEITYKLMTKGIDKDVIETYISEHENVLKEYELDSAKKIVSKKTAMEPKEIVQYLIKKGYSSDTLKRLKEIE